MQPLVEKYKPATLDGFVGMERARAILNKLADAPYSSAWLLLGDSGLGKTTMALALAAKIRAEIHHIPSRKCDLETVDQVVHKCFYVPLGGTDRFHVIIVDEADQMSRAAQHAFLSKLDTTAAPPNTIFIFTANDTALLESRFLSRCRTLKFSTEGLLDPTVALLDRIWRKESTNPVPDLRAIATAAHLNIRQAIMDRELEMIAPSGVTSLIPSIRASSSPAIDIRSRALELRRQKVPLSLIAKQLNAPQSSVWRWTRGA